MRGRPGLPAKPWAENEGPQKREVEGISQREEGGSEAHIKGKDWREGLRQVREWGDDLSPG